MFRSHAGYVAGYVASGGVIGLTSRWGVLPAAVVLLPSALNASPLFIIFNLAFQSWAAVLFLVAGSALALQRVSEQGLPRSFIAAFGGLTLAVSLTVGVLYVRVIPFFADRVRASAGTKLGAFEKRVPLGAEVIVSYGDNWALRSRAGGLLLLPSWYRRALHRKRRRRARLVHSRARRWAGRGRSNGELAGRELPGAVCRRNARHRGRRHLGIPMGPTERYDFFSPTTMKVLSRSVTTRGPYPREGSSVGLRKHSRGHFGWPLGSARRYRPARCASVRDNRCNG